MGFGDQLKQAREARGVSLGAVAKATRIAPRNLEALERSDLEGLPRGPFGRGYVRAYAEFLGIDPQPILEAYHSQERQRGLGPSATQRRTLDELSQLVKQRSQAQRRGLLSPRLTWGALALIALGILAAGGWFLIGREASDADAANSPRPAGQRTREAQATADAPESEATPATPEPVKVGATPAPTPRGTRATERPVGVPAPAPDGPNPQLRVSHSGVGTGIESRRLVGRGDRFNEGAELVFWTRVLGGRPGDQIRHIWIREGRGVMRADLSIGGSHWRTHSRLELPRGSSGSWVAEARTLEGRVLAREEFVCVSEGQ